MSQQKRGYRRFTTAVPPAPTEPRYRTVALKPETYDKVVYWANHLRDEWGRCSLNDAIDFLVDNVGTPPEEE
jgi:hypothetical protein